MSSSPASEVTATPVTLAAPGASRQSTLCAGSCARPSCASSASASPAAERIVPPPSASVFASTATPSVETFGSTTSCANTSAVVPVPLS